uniref:Uncharacterized protein n=1 Tax=Chromera velia CCMP2878 TaxID=1169474 RepID=A0A0G4FCE4_9ALVE|eukprot:Cvel_16334.t1-p1 / transcript=Cvel_16334.t1 / gene=Cvel_16334 / organism=Chromera_velia_CCMP2878 / gene_product=hypothetical protein / transcript_product=hypothetical protein / location=Cvel_scaffold1253:44975-45640(+) / protein_length=222 / sequence_SO=supercontig / SO=protein_coding / is_pseudo=false
MEEKLGNPTKVQMNSIDEKTPTLEKTLVISNLASGDKGAILRLETDNEAECISMKPSFDLTIFVIEIADDGSVTPTFDCTHCRKENPEAPMAFCQMQSKGKTCVTTNKKEDKDHNRTDVPTDLPQDTDADPSPGREEPDTETVSDPASKGNKEKDANAAASNSPSEPEKGMGTVLAVSIAIGVFVGSMVAAVLWNRRRMSTSTAPLLDRGSERPQAGSDPQA